MFKPPAPVVPTNNLRVRRPINRGGIQGNNDLLNKVGTPLAQAPQINSNITQGNTPVKNIPPPAQVHGGFASGNGTSTMNSGAPPAFDPNDPTQTDNAAMKAIYDLISQGPRDTTADESQIQNELASQTGQGQADLNARMGAAGFGTSGALGAASGDMRRQNALAAEGKIQGVRKDARDEYLNRVMAGLEGEFKDRGMDMSEEQYQNYLNMLMATSGVDGGGTGSDYYNGSGSTGQNTNGDGLTQQEADAKNQHNQEQQNQSRFDAQGGQNMVANPDSVQTVTAAPSGGQYMGDANGFAWYFIPGPDNKNPRKGGKYVKVKHA